MKAITVMVQGTSSDAGKSLLCTALCRWLARQGVAVAPFKPQNMALNSAVTEDGGEIGRAQAVQAMACGLQPHTDMNPVLLKPNSDTGAQVIIHGHVAATLEAGAYQDFKPVARQAVLASHERLAARYEVIVCEGAGSPAEINLRRHDIANMGFAEAVDCPVILVADIDRGGVFAHLVGTLELLSPTEQARIQGFVINRFRGQRSLLDPGLVWLEQKTGKPVLGVLPYLPELYLEAEDSLPNITAKSGFRVIVPAFPRLSNHTDFDPLRLHPDIDLRFIKAGETPPAADLICLPGSKSVRADLDWLCQQGWEAVIKRHLRYGGKIIGICGGFQILGQQIHDPHGVEGTPGSRAGLSWLAMETTLTQHKQLRQVHGHLAWGGVPLSGYEIHMGISQGPALDHPATLLDTGPEGARSPDEQILGSYVHGLFDHPQACAALLAWAGLKSVETPDLAQRREQDFNRLADAIDTHLDTRYLAKLFGLPSTDMMRMAP